MQVMKGCLDGLLGKETDIRVESKPEAAPSQAGERSEQRTVLEEADIKFGYCTEFIINVEKEYGDRQEREFKTYLETIGDSIVVVSDDDVVKVHVHTNDPGLAIQKALTFGSLSRMKIDNMREEHEERLIKDSERKAREQKAMDAGDPGAALSQEDEKAQPRKEYGFIAVSIGRGFGEIFQGIGADYLIEGGQTMNPSTEDMLNAIDKVNADTIYILPNNSNIILAAEQAASLAEDKNIVVVPSKTVPQGIAAIINFVPDLSPQENKEAMMAEMSRVKTGQITYAVRDTVIDDKEIHSGDIMGIGDGGILCVGKSVMDTALDTLKAMVDEESELITIYYGVDIEDETAEKFLERVEEAWPQCEVELHSGGQPIYYYLMSVE